MTLEECLYLLCLRHALTTLEAELRQREFAAVPESTHCLNVIAEQLRWSESLLTGADPLIRAAADALLRAEILTPSADPSTLAPVIAWDGPTRPTIH